MNTDALLAALRVDEGLRLKPYLDTASPPKITIGYGRNLSDKGISYSEAEAMLIEDARAAMRDAVSLVPNWAALDDVRKNVLSNMSFNLGRSRLSKFKTFLAAVNEGRFADASVAMLDSAWATQVGNRAKRLAKEMLTGAA